MSIRPAQQGRRGRWNRLHDAARNGSVEHTVALLSSGLIDIDEGDAVGWTPLMFAVASGHLPVASILLSRDADVSIANDDGFTALLLATQFGHLTIAKMLMMMAGADIETMSPQGCTPLHVAADYGHLEVMKALIQAGAKPNSRLPNGETPLFLAARRGCVDATRELLRAEANPLLAWRSEGTTKWCPLHVAVHKGHLGVVRELIHQVGIESCCGGKSGVEEALCLAAGEGHVDIMAMLTEAGVIDTGTGLVAAAENGLEASVKFFLQQKKDKTTGGSAYVDFRDSGGMTPLLCSIVYPHSSSPRVARLLIDAGADTKSEVRNTSGSGGNGVLFDSTLLAVADFYLSVKAINGETATEEQLHRLEAIRRLLLQVEAVHAVSWLWPSCVMSTAHAGERPGRARMDSPPLTGMLPILRRRAGRRRVLLSALFRY